VSHSVISLGLGLGGGKSATASGGGGGGVVVFSVGVVDTQANILARSSDPAGTIGYGTDTENYYIFTGSLWFNYPEQR
jgi:hypothetical protein